MTNEDILKLARATLDVGLCFDMTARITRSTDAEILAFARALLAKERDDLLAWKHRNEFNARVGAAMQQACRDLPAGYDIHIELEKDAGTVRLYLSGSAASITDLGGDDMADSIYNAINIAQAKGLA